MSKRSVLLISTLMVVGMTGGGFVGAFASDALTPEQRPLMEPITTAFSYQGYLEDSGIPANGTYDLTFELYDDAILGSQIGGTRVADDVLVAGGVFTISLDFGDVFDGTAYWLEIWVRPGSSTGGYQQLLPRQSISPVPYASNANRLDGMDSTAFAFSGDVVPSGAVMFFNLATCPSGWTELAEAQGRAIIGLSDGGSLAGSVGVGLEDLEDRTHTHDVNPSSFNTSSSGAHSHSVDPPSTNTSSSGDHNHSVNPPQTDTDTSWHHHRWAYFDSNSNWWSWDSSDTAYIMVNWGDGMDSAGSGYFPIGEDEENFYDPWNYYTSGVSHHHAVDIPSFTSGTSGSHNHNVNITPFTSSTSGTHSHSVDVPNTSSTTASTSDVMPYIQLLACEKD